MKKNYTGVWKKTEETADYTKWQNKFCSSETYIMVSKQWEQDNSFFSEFRNEGIQVKIFDCNPTFDWAFKRIKNYVGQFEIKISND